MSDNGHQTHAPSLVAVAAGLGEQTPLLAALLAEARSGTLEVAVADGHRRELVLSKFPVTGAKRAIAYRTGAGFDSFTVPATGPPAGALVIPANQARLGGQIVNYGTNPVILYLTERPVPTSGVPAIWLAGTGGTWDFRLGNVCWCGNISALGIGGTSTLTVAEV